MLSALRHGFYDHFFFASSLLVGLVFKSFSLFFGLSFLFLLFIFVFSPLCVFSIAVVSLGLLFSFFGQFILILSAPISFVKLFATNFVSLSSGFWFCSSSSYPFDLRGSTVSALHLQDFSVAFVILGIVQSVVLSY